MTDRTIPDEHTGIHLYTDEDGVTKVDILLPTNIPEDGELDDLPMHTQLALDLMQALARIVNDIREAPTTTLEE